MVVLSERGSDFWVFVPKWHEDRKTKRPRDRETERQTYGDKNINIISLRMVGMACERCDGGRLYRWEARAVWSIPKIPSVFDQDWLFPTPCLLKTSNQLWSAIFEWSLDPGVGFGEFDFMIPPYPVGLLVTVIQDRQSRTTRSNLVPGFRWSATSPSLISYHIHGSCSLYWSKQCHYHNHINWPTINISDYELQKVTSAASVPVHPVLPPCSNSWSRSFYSNFFCATFRHFCSLFCAKLSEAKRMLVLILALDACLR